MGGDFTFSYDARGNLRGRLHSLTGATMTTAYDGLDRVVSQGAGSIAYTYLYDAPPFAGSPTTPPGGSRRSGSTRRGSRRPS